MIHAPIPKLRQLVDGCCEGIIQVSLGWVEAACKAKRIPFDRPIAAEEILSGPTTVLRYLRVLSKVLQEIADTGSPLLPNVPRINSLGRQCIPVLPVNRLYDRLTFLGLKAEVWRQTDSDPRQIFTINGKGRSPEPRIAGVLGAGNVSSIPATDTLYKIFHDREAVLLKLNPVNDYLEPFLSEAFRPLIEASLLRIVCGGSEIGKALVDHDSVGSLHITGSHLTHDAIVWGKLPEERAIRLKENRPLITKPITSELGNVTPWIIVPGVYSQRQLKAQAEHVVASIVNNASFNCLATKMIVTSRGWGQRSEFLDLIDSYFQKIPPRFAYYPGAHERFARATGKPSPSPDDGSLPWTLLRDTHSRESPQLFQEESFVCVCAETQLDEPDPLKFLDSAVDFVNDQLFGTLCATLTLPNRFQRNHGVALEHALAKLQYGSVCINQWSGVAYGLMTPPWGGAPGATIADPKSGIGHVHNTFCINNIDKTVLSGPLWSFPKPVWFPTHRTSDQVSWDLLRLYEKPNLLRLPKLFFNALRG